MSGNMSQSRIASAKWAAASAVLLPWSAQAKSALADWRAAPNSRTWFGRNLQFAEAGVATFAAETTRGIGRLPFLQGDFGQHHLEIDESRPMAGDSLNSFFRSSLPTSSETWVQASNSF